MNARKKQIIDAAHYLFTEKGFVNTSIQEVLDKAGVAKGTFYNYFSSKSECLIAILDYVKEEGDQKRAELAYGKPKTDEQVFAEQLAVRINMNRQYRLFGLFQAASISIDKEFQGYVKNQHGTELDWISRRIVEVYPLKDDRFCLDYATLLIGMIHQLIHVWSMGAEKEVKVEKVIQYALSQLRFIIQGDHSSMTPFFDRSWLIYNNLDQVDSSSLKQQLVSLIQDTVRKMNKIKGTNTLEYLQFLEEELGKENPRHFLIESVVLTMSHHLESSSLEHEVKRVEALTWKWLENVKKEQSS
ncbi:TetR/AcrR family transcriptional regulator [Radiobacillus kanasensis]|uniref:TetR/AcrR family transcriptional regulator n=1 Tax=Radiobacillus kanasensis TaxID=2844358 RepID=UPI001E31E3F9|nr:TetR/AcrR family transcriptional regulator [Radiobacillus kanasensis]UFT99236.1 TetR/AcrR family transcriptional regulator [Radiobacillus kanasensis]